MLYLLSFLRIPVYIYIYFLLYFHVCVVKLICNSDDNGCINICSIKSIIRMIVITRLMIKNYKSNNNNNCNNNKTTKIVMIMIISRHYDNANANDNPNHNQNNNNIIKIIIIMMVPKQQQ